MHQIEKKWQIKKQTKNKYLNIHHMIINCNRVNINFFIIPFSQYFLQDGYHLYSIFNFKIQFQINIFLMQI